LEANLRNHAGGTKHAEKVTEATNLKRTAISSGKQGRPSKTTGDNSFDKQKQLHAFFGHVVDIPEVQNSPAIDRNFCKILMCWGFRGPRAVYGGKSFEVLGLLFDIKPGQRWFVEPWLQEVVVLNGECIKINGTFRHHNCLRMSTNNKP